jgi:hypothetical protein
MASFSSFWSEDFEVLPLQVPETSPTQRAQPRLLEQTQADALTDMSSDEVAGVEPSSDELPESSRADSLEKETETNARSVVRVVSTSPGPDVEADPGTDERNVLTAQHAPFDLSGMHTLIPQVTRAQESYARTRDGSRAQSVITVGSSGEICELCQTYGHQRHYCNVCTVVLCDPCWESQFLHRTERANTGSLPHEKTNPHVAKKIKAVLNPQLKEEQREKLHLDDIDTTWFGVVREGERPMFQDYGRYADLVAGVKDLRRGSVSASSDPSEALYPSLVSFVGETGAGKSSLVKLIIDLESGDDEPFETPVVGAAGRDVATSEDVHLYLDPDSSESQAPLLFADCEGLNGGERDPVGAKFKMKMASSQKNNSGGRGKPTSERELAWADTAKKQSRDFAVANLYPRLLYTFSDVIVFVVKNPRYALMTADSS